MKLLLRCLCLFAWFSMYGENISNIQIHEKMYINAEQVIVGENGIFVCCEGEIASIESLNYDQHGLYFMKIEKPKAWICQVCGNDNYFWQNRCPGCRQRNGY